MLGRKSPKKSVTEVVLVEAAAQLFARHGFKATTSREIAQLAALNEATLFRYFPRKLDLFLAALESHLNRVKFGHDLRVSLASDDVPEVVLPKIVAFFLKILNTQPELRSLLQVARFELPEAEKMIEEHVGTIFDALCAYFKRSADREAICKIEPELVALGLLGVVSAHQLFREAFTSGRTQKVNSENPADAYVNLWLHGLVRKKTVVVIGAGNAAAMLLSELPGRGYLPVVLVDDDPLKAGVRLQGVPVAGTVNELPHVVLQYHPDELMICIPSATGKEMRRIIEVCDETRLRFRTIPGLGELINGTVTVDQLRDVNLRISWAGIRFISTSIP